MTDRRVPDDITDRTLIGAIEARDVMRMQVETDAYKAISALLLAKVADEPLPTKELAYVRGLARLGLDSPPDLTEDGIEAQRLHETLMATLSAIGAEPYSSEEMAVQMQAAIAFARQQQNQSAPPMA